ncbi:MAG: hypothetical protein ABIT83_19170 [Massilia sp.]
MPVILIIAITWIFVVGLMALTEPSVVGGMMTFLGYCVLPLSILYYLAGSKHRRARAQRTNSPSDNSYTPAYFASDAGNASSTGQTDDAERRTGSGGSDECKAAGDTGSPSDSSADSGSDCGSSSGSDSGSGSSSDSSSSSSD